MTNTPAPTPSASAQAGPTLAIAISARLADLRRKYRMPDGQLKNQYRRHRLALEALESVHQCPYDKNSPTLSDMPVWALSLEHIEAAQNSMIDTAKLSRTTVNERMSHIRAAVKEWAKRGRVPRTLPGEVAELVEPVRAGEAGLREPQGKQLVSWEDFSDTLAALGQDAMQARTMRDKMASVRAAAICELLWYSGARPSEIYRLRRSWLHEEDGLFVFKPQKHKTQRFGRERVVYFGPDSSSLLRRWIADAEKSGRDRLFPINRTAFPALIRKTQERHGLNKWTPGQLRHSFATRTRSAHGIDAAQTLLGHASVRTTEIYARPSETSAMRAIRDAG